MNVDQAETLPSETRTAAPTLLQMSPAEPLRQSWVTERYDRYVLGHRARAAGDAGVIRIDENTGAGVALAVDGNGRYAPRPVRGAPRLAGRTAMSP
jgi:phosphoribosylformylglycinamidine synthase